MGRLPRENVRTARLLLREPCNADISDIKQLLASAGSSTAPPQLPAPVGAGEVDDWVRQRAPSLWESGGACFVIVEAARGGLLGAVVVAGRSLGTGIPSAGAHTGICSWLTPAARGQGFGNEAVTAVSDWALRHGVYRLEALTALDDPAGQRVALSAGYRREGVTRGAGIGPDGSRHDMVLWARLATDAPGPTPRLLPDLPGGELSDGVVALHPLGPADADDAYLVRQLPEVTESSVPPAVPSRQQVASGCATAASQWLAGAVARLSIRDAPSDRFAGEIILMYAEPPTGTGVVGYHLAPQWRGHGFATRAVRLLSAWALDEAGLARLEAGVNVANTASQAVLARAGFRRVGRQQSRRPGLLGRVDDYLYELVTGV